jgi:S-formylglutathione hydrolase FrmB
MLNTILSLHLIKGPVPVAVDVLGILALAAIFATRRWKRWLPIALGALVVGFLVGLAICWLLGDLLDLFGVTLSVASRVWFGIGVAGLFLGVARLVFSRKRTAALWVASAVILALVGGLGVNADLGEFPTVKNALGIGQYREISLPSTGATTTVAKYTAPADLPKYGRAGLVTIPATVSHFQARQAMVYLPPAALVANPPRLPVLELISGQPGEPADLFTKGALATRLNALARAHHGLTPIVVVPDQLGAPSRNPMCLNSSLGNSATYLTVDVPNWINSHLAVLSGASEWGIGGFSEGGTCAIQFGAALPKLYGTIVDISGEIAPKNGSLKQTISAGFGGSATAYSAAIPANIMKKVADYSQTLALFSVGQGDTRYGPGLKVVATDAVTAGMNTQLFVSPGTAHDWHTVGYALDHSLPVIEHNWHLDD